MYQLCGTKRYVWIKLCAKVDGFSLIFSLMQKVNGGYWRLNCNEKVLLLYKEMLKCSIFYRKNDKTIEFKSLCPCHTEMTFGCQMTTQARSSRQQRSFFVQNRNHFVGLRFCCSNLIIDPYISLVCILVFLPTLENSRTPCLFVHFTKGRVSVFHVQKTII